jgi:hypothetical protein
MSPASSKNTSCTFNIFNIFNHCIRLGHFPALWKEAEIITLPIPGKDPKFPPNLRLISFLFITGKLSEKVILRTIQKHTGDRNLINESQFDFRAHHIMTFQCITLNSNNNMSVELNPWALKGL